MRDDDYKRTEGEALRALFRGRRQSEFARDYELPGGASMLNQHLTGARPVNIEAAIVYARGLGVSISEFSPRLAELIEQASRVAARTSSGSETTAPVAQPLDVRDLDEYPAYSWDQIANMPTLPSRFSVTMPDTALVPNVLPGQELLFRTDIRPKPGDGVLVEARANGSRFVRAYMDTPVGWAAIAMNKAHPDMSEADSSVVATMVGRLDGKVV